MEIIIYKTNDIAGFLTRKSISYFLKFANFSVIFEGDSSNLFEKI